MMPSGDSASPASMGSSGGTDGFSFAWLVDLDGVTIEIGVGKERSGVLKVHNGEKEFAVVFIDPGASTYNLLEFGHAVDPLIENNEVQVWASTPVDMSCEVVAITG